MIELVIPEKAARAAGVKSRVQLTVQSVLVSEEGGVVDRELFGALHRTYGAYIVASNAEERKKVRVVLKGRYGNTIFGDDAGQPDLAKG